MTTLTLGQFNPVKLDSRYFCLEYPFQVKDRSYTLCLEPCLNGYDIAIYDDKKDLVCQKRCMDQQYDVPFDEVLQVATNYLVEFLKEVK